MKKYVIEVIQNGGVFNRFNAQGLNAIDAFENACEDGTFNCAYIHGEAEVHAITQNMMKIKFQIGG
jgi:hypothetical protein